jgi:hypothetical protein
MQEKIKILKFIFLSVIIVSLFTYRDFLYNVKLMLFHFYNYKMLPLDPYYQIILKYSGLSNDHFRFPWEWRVIPNIINWLAFEILPCFKPRVIPDQISDSTYCSIWSISVVNFIAGIFAQVLLCYYAFIKLKRENYECIFLMFTSYFLIKFLDPFGVDRISFLFLIIFLFFEKSKFSYFFIIFSILVNDKCLLFITTYYFCKTIDYNNLKKIILNKKSLISLLISILYLCYIFKIIRDINSEEVSYNYFNFNSLTNTILPSLIVVFPFFANFQNRKILHEFNLDKNHIYFILIFFILGLVVGGPGNTGRYVVFGSLLFLPILNYQILKIIRNLLSNINNE